MYIPINPEDRNNRRAVNLAFVSQSAPDIRKKLQRMEGFEGKNLSELVEIAQRVFNNRDEVDIAQTKKMIKVLLATMQGVEPKGLPRKGRGREQAPRANNGPRRAGLEKDQCAYCKKKGHWKNERPEKGQAPEKKAPFVLFEDAE